MIFPKLNKCNWGVNNLIKYTLQENKRRLDFPGKCFFNGFFSHFFGKIEEDNTRVALRLTLSLVCANIEHRTFYFLIFYMEIFLRVGFGIFRGICTSYSGYS
jgi:hypothetical protein